LTRRKQKQIERIENLTKPPETLKTIKPVTKKQKSYLELLTDFSIPYVIGVGPAGTGKTLLAVLAGLRMFYDEEISKIVLTRPIIDAGESIGYLPGKVEEKIHPYLMPLFDSVEKCIGIDRFRDLKYKGRIEIVPLAYMRGRTFENCFIILDEAQNATKEQIKMAVTRLGKNSKICITGDLTQTDLPKGRSGLSFWSKLLKNENYCRLLTFENSDIQRRKEVGYILEKLERIENRGNGHKDSELIVDELKVVNFGNE